MMVEANGATHMDKNYWNYQKNLISPKTNQLKMGHPNMMAHYTRNLFGRQLYAYIPNNNNDDNDNGNDNKGFLFIYKQRKEKKVK